jgi:hypothetical protein
MSFVGRFNVSVNEMWTLKENGKARITAAEMTFLRRTEKYTLCDHKRNLNIMKDVKTEPVLKKNQLL